MVSKLTGKNLNLVYLRPATWKHHEVNGNLVEFVDSFTSLGSTVRSKGSSEPEIRRHMTVALECMKALYKNIW